MKINFFFYRYFIFIFIFSQNVKIGFKEVKLKGIAYTNPLKSFGHYILKNSEGNTVGLTEKTVPDSAFDNQGKNVTVYEESSKCKTIFESNKKQK